MLDDVEIDIDSWPMIPTYLEIEGESEEQVNKMIEKLDVDKSKITALNCNDIFKEIYNIDQLKIKELKFWKNKKISKNDKKILTNKNKNDKMSP